MRGIMRDGAQQGHATCDAHQLRQLQALVDSGKQKWAGSCESC